MDYFDLAADYDGDLANAFRGTKTRFLLVSFTSDWLFPTAGEPRDRAGAEPRGGERVSSSRSRPTRATTRSCWTSRIFTARWRGSWRGARCMRGWRGSGARTWLS